MFPKYYYPLKTTVRCFLLPSEQPGSLLGAIWCSLEILNTELLLPLFARWHAAKLKTGSTGSCDQLARVPLVLRRVLARVRDRTCERNSFQPVFMCDPFPPFFLTKLRWITIHTFVSTLDYWLNTKISFFSPCLTFFFTALESDSNLQWWEMERQSRWINILPVFTTFLAAVYPSALLEKHTLFAAP